MPQKLTGIQALAQFLSGGLQGFAPTYNARKAEGRATATRAKEADTAFDRSQQIAVQTAGLTDESNRLLSGLAYGREKALTNDEIIQRNQDRMKLGDFARTLPPGERRDRIMDQAMGGTDLGWKTDRGYQPTNTDRRIVDANNQLAALFEELKLYEYDTDNPRIKEIQLEIVRTRKMIDSLNQSQPGYRSLPPPEPAAPEPVEPLKNKPSLWNRITNPPPGVDFPGSGLFPVIKKTFDALSHATTPSARAKPEAQQQSTGDETRLVDDTTTGQQVTLRELYDKYYSAKGTWQEFVNDWNKTHKP